MEVSYTVAGTRKINNMYDKIFIENEACFEYLISSGIIKPSIPCLGCTKYMTIQNNEREINKKIYKCTNYKCRRSKTILINFNSGMLKIPLMLQLRAIYFYVCNIPNYFAFPNSEFTEKSFVKLRKLLIKKCKGIILKNKRPLGGEEKTVQIDETAFKKGMIIRNPSTHNDDDPQTIWLIGVVEEGSGRAFLEFVQNRKINDVSRFIKNNVLKGSVIKTDGYPSYIKAVKDNECEHIVVSHKNGFRNEMGHTTNTIEGLWSLLKHDIKKRKGINRNILKDYIYEFLWRYSKIKNTNTDTWSDEFYNLLYELKN